MTSVRRVPETRRLPGDELSADDAWRTVRRYGAWALARDGFMRFRYGDGFSHARAFALLLALAVVPLVIAAAGLSAALGAESVGEVVARTVVAITPSTSDQLIDQAVRGDADDAGPEGVGEVALTLGLITAFVAATSAFAQLERGANRIYGVHRDRPTLAKYGLAALLAATAGTAVAFGLLLMVAGDPLGNAVEEVYGWGADARTTWDLLRWPVGLLSLVVAVTLVFAWSPRRQQPGLSWLVAGGVLTVLVWLAVTGLLALYVSTADSFGDTYGALTAVIALLIWANLSGIALLGGLALAAQVEAARSGETDPLLPDPDDDGSA